MASPRCFFPVSFSSCPLSLPPEPLTWQRTVHQRPFLGLPQTPTFRSGEGRKHLHLREQAEGVSEPGLPWVLLNLHLFLLEPWGPRQGLISSAHTPGE